MQLLAKRAPGGAQEAERRVAEPPEKLYPARATLATKLDQIERAQKDLSDFTARAERAGVDENRAMEDETLSETEAAEKIQTAQMQKNVMKVRIAIARKQLSSLERSLPQRLPPARTSCAAWSIWRSAGARASSAIGSLRHSKPATPSTRD